MDPFIAEIRLFGFNFPPRGWATCDGQILPIQQNTALFSLLGTTYGGDGRSTFALPNLQQRFPLGAGQGPGLSNHALGETGGQAQVSLTNAEMPAHTHSLTGVASGGLNSPANAGLAPPATGAYTYRMPTNPVDMAPNSIGGAGGGTGHENRQPTLNLNFCIALQGVFPQRP